MNTTFRMRGLRRRGGWISTAVALATALVAGGADARIVRIKIDSTTAATGTGQVLPYQTIRGRAWGELDPADAKNAVITDLQLVRDLDGKVRYVTSFTLTVPVDPSQASGFLWHDVPNRGGNFLIPVVERNLGDIGLASGWQADNAGGTAVPASAADPAATVTTTNHWVIAPTAKNANGSEVTGNVLGRIVNRSNMGGAPLNVMGNPIPYLPATIDTAQAALKTRIAETVNGVITEGTTIPGGEWAYTKSTGGTCGTKTFEQLAPGDVFDNSSLLLPGSLPVCITVKGGFNSSLLYQVIYPAKNAYALGVGVAAFRDVGSFFRFAVADDFGNANPVAGRVVGTSMRGSSQSGNFTRQFIYMGMNQDEAGRRLHDGAWPQIAGRRVAANVRWGQPDGVLELYQMGSEGAQWWVDHPDTVRGLPTKGILSRCTLSNTCPKVVEHFGGAEVYALKMTMSWVGTAGDFDIPLTRNVRRYYIPSTTHGGGSGAMTQAPPNTAVNCPGNNWGQGTLLANPMPSSDMVNVIRASMRNWVLNGTPPPPSRWPTLTGGTLVDATKVAMGFPSNVPGIPDSIFAPENFAFPVFDYDWGPEYNASDATGNPTNLPPPIRIVIPSKVPKVDADGNELGGVPTTLRDAPLGTYLGWNITAAGFHRGQVCNYVGGYVPFAVTRAQRLATSDQRLSLQERYGSHDGYVAAVTVAANNALQQGYLLAADRDALIARAQASDVLVGVPPLNPPRSKTGAR